MELSEVMEQAEVDYIFNFKLFGRDSKHTFFMSFINPGVSVQILVGKKLYFFMVYIYGTHNNIPMVYRSDLIKTKDDLMLKNDLREYLTEVYSKIKDDDNINDDAKRFLSNYTY